MDLNELLIFARVAQAGSFSAAARALGLPKSTVSRKVAVLEERLGARLLQRTTRRVSLTDAGRAYQQHCARILAAVEEGERAVSHMQEAPRGLLRVTAPVTFAYLWPILAEYLERHPAVQADLVHTDRRVDLVEEGFDVAIRAGHLADSSLIARRLGTEWRVAVASPAYLQRHGAPAQPAALADHDGIAFGAERTHWRLERGPQRVAIPMAPRLVVNDFHGLREAALAGLGIALIPVHVASDDLRAGRLQRVLPDWRSPQTPIHAVYPSNRFLAPKVAAFLDLLLERMTPPPWQITGAG